MTCVQQVCDFVEVVDHKNAAEITHTLYSIGGKSMAKGVQRVLKVGQLIGIELGKWPWMWKGALIGLVVGGGVGYVVGAFRGKHQTVVIIDDTKEESSDKPDTYDTEQPYESVSTEETVVQVDPDELASTEQGAEELLSASD